MTGSVRAVAAAAATRTRPPSPWRVGAARLASRHPERWVVVAAVVAWTVLLAAGPSLDGAAHGAAHGGALHGMHGGGTAATAAWPVLAPTATWLLMVVAMMGPVMVPRVRRVAQSCLGRVRGRATAATLAGALLVWCTVGLVVVPAAAAVPPLDAGRAPVAFAGVWLLVAAYGLTPARLAALGRCHAVRVPRGEADTLSRLTAGVAYSGWCAASCGPAMAAMALTGHPLVPMVVLTVGLTAERVAHRPQRTVRRVAAALAVSAVLVAVVGADRVPG